MSAATPYDTGAPTRTHDWSRSLSATNSYWKNTLSEEEIHFVQELNDWIFQALEAKAVQHPVLFPAALMTEDRQA